MAFNTKLNNLLKSDSRFVDDDGELILAAVQDAAWKVDRNLVKLLLSDPEIKAVFFESEICANATEYEGTRDFKEDWIHKIFKDKILKFDAKNPRAVDDAQFEHFVSNKDWFAFNTIYGTSEEKAFVRMLDRQMHKLQARYDEIYLLRNEEYFAIYNFSDGRTFRPDFVLFLREKGGELLTYQLFIEPKGGYLKEHDRWKEDFLKEITDEFGSSLLIFKDKKYRLIGVPFYNNEDENRFRASLEFALS